MKKNEQKMKHKKKEATEVEYLVVERIDSKLYELGMTRSELTKKVKGVKGTFAKNTIANWTVRRTIPSADVALTIADALKCSVRWLITGTDDIQEEYSVEEKMLVSKFRALDEQGKNYVRALLNAGLAAAETVSEPEVIVAVEKKLSVG